MAAPADAGLSYDAEGSAAAAKLPDNMSGYLAAGFLNGNSAPMPAAASGGRDTFDGWFVVGGLGAKAEIAFEADATLRDDFRNQSYRARISIRF